jgi:hypothetical protein
MVFDGPNGVGAVVAARDAYSEAGDHWASGLFRSEIASLLVKRCLEQQNFQEEDEYYFTD